MRERADMNTTKHTRPTGAATAILLGFAIAVTPVTAHATQAGATPAMVPTGPDIVLAATENLRQLVEADRVPAVLVRPADKTLRQLVEADRVPAVLVRPADKTLRQLMEEDRAAGVSTRPFGEPAPQLTEEDRPPIVAPRPSHTPAPQMTEEDRPPLVSSEVPQPTVRPLPKGDRR
ncbi:hypothetical protein GCM10009749_30200 [Agromyces neolithicus]|uniref:Secreted protein n=2 Tax=Agromyces neolithicus TaxID=269420 RepID=A0ABN2MAW4_9MICO